MSAHPPRWTEDRARRFAEDWNAGLPAEGLQEKYGIRRPATVAQWLRKRGVALARRYAAPRNRGRGVVRDVGGAG